MTQVYSIPPSVFNEPAVRFIDLAPRSPRCASHWAQTPRPRNEHQTTEIGRWQLPARFADDTTDMTFTADRLAAVTARTLTIAGDADPLYPVELAVELHRGVRSSALDVVPGGAHAPIFEPEHRARFVERALAWMA